MLSKQTVYNSTLHSQRGQLVSFAWDTHRRRTLSLCHPAVGSHAVRGGPSMACTSDRILEEPWQTSRLHAVRRGE